MLNFVGTPVSLLDHLLLEKNTLFILVCPPSLGSGKRFHAKILAHKWRDTIVK